MLLRGYDTSMTPASIQTYGLLVLGSGPAGMHAAAAYLEAEGPGEVCVLSTDTDEPYERPPLSKDILSGEEPPQVSPILDDASVLERIDLRLGLRVDVLDTARRRVGTDDGQEIAYERLVIATGSEPTDLSGVEPGAPVSVLRSLEDARRIVDSLAGARAVVVVGSGFIGCEAAASLASRGLRTTLVSPEKAPQEARLGEWAGARVARWLSEAGVELRLERKIDMVTETGVVRLDDGSRMEADLVVAAVGVTQSRSFIEESALRTDEGRIVVDEELRTSDPHVWAAGDVARAQHAVAGRSLSVEHWGDAMAMGEIAGTNAASAGQDASGSPRRWSGPPGFWSEIAGHTLKHSAWGDGFERSEVVEHDEGAFTIWYGDADGELVGVLTHERDEDYERGGDLLARRASLAEALAGDRPDEEETSSS